MGIEYILVYYFHTKAMTLKIIIFLICALNEIWAASISEDTHIHLHLDEPKQEVGTDYSKADALPASQEQYVLNTKLEDFVKGGKSSAQKNAPGGESMVQKVSPIGKDKAQNNAPAGESMVQNN